MQKIRQSVAPGSLKKPRLNTMQKTLHKTQHHVVNVTLQGHPERVLKVNPFARALIFTKSGFSGVFWDEK